MGDRGSALQKSCPQPCHLQIPSLICRQGREWSVLWGDVQGQGAGSQAPLALLSRWSGGARAYSSDEVFYGSSFRISQPRLLCHQRGLELIWSQVKACKAPGVDGTHSLTSLFEDEGGKNPCIPLLTQLAWAVGLVNLK